jgi:hypothetical protein
VGDVPAIKSVSAFYEAYPICHFCITELLVFFQLLAVGDDFILDEILKGCDSF